MNVEFYSAHMDTLCKLKILAEKHNCSINFGFRTDSDTEELNYDSICNGEKRIINILENPFDNFINIENIKSETEVLWFQLYDPNGERHYHTMSYCEYNDYFEIEKDWHFDDLVNQKFIDWCEEHQLDTNYDNDKYVFYISTAPTIINGFGYKNPHKDERVYRSGMALKYFADLVCKYLHEKPIVNTY